MSKSSISEAIAFINSEIAPLYAGQLTQQLFDDAVSGGRQSRELLKLSGNQRRHICGLRPHTDDIRGRKAIGGNIYH